MGGPLDGVKVVEISMFQQGPVAGMRLGDLGADVIKIETKSGDPARGFMKIIGAMAGLNGNNYYFEHNNRNKRSIAHRSEKRQGNGGLFQAHRSGGCFPQQHEHRSSRQNGHWPGGADARNPRLIYAHASGWGRKGPDAQDLSFDYTGIARSGLMMACGERGAPPDSNPSRHRR